jgi:hypothetical protein
MTIWYAIDDINMKKTLHYISRDAEISHQLKSTSLFV